MIENPNNRINSSPLRRGPKKDYVIENKLRVLKKNMAPNSYNR